MSTKNIYVALNGTTVLEASISKDEIPTEVFEDKKLLKRITDFVKYRNLGFSFKLVNGTVLLQQVLDDKLLTTKDFFDRSDLFNNHIHIFIDFVRNLKQEMEEQNLPVSQESEEIELIKTLLKDFEESKVYGVEFIVVKQDNIGQGGMTPKLWKELLTSFIKTHEL